MAGETKFYQKEIDRGLSRDKMEDVDFTSPFSRENPLAGQRYFDKGASDLAHTIGGRDAGYFEDKIGHGLLDSQMPEASVDEKDPMLQALSSRYDTQFKDALRGITAETKASAPVMASSSATRGAGMASEIHGKEISNYNEQAAFQAERENILNQWKAARSQAKSGLLGAIFGGLGAIGGAIIGGPAGAIAGASAGSTAGKA